MVRVCGLEDALAVEEAGRDGATGGFDGGDSRGGGTGDSDVDGNVESGCAAGEKLDAVFDAVEATGLAELFEGDRLGGINALGFYPTLEMVQVERGHFFRELIFKPIWARHNLILRLPSIHPRRYTTMLTLSLMTSSRSLTLARTRTSAPPNELLVGVFEVVE